MRSALVEAAPFRRASAAVRAAALLGLLAWQAGAAAPGLRAEPLPQAARLNAADACLQVERVGQAWPTDAEESYRGQALGADGDIAVAASGSLLQVVDLVRSSEPQVVGQMDLGSQVKAVVGVAGGRAYVLLGSGQADTGSLRVVDLVPRQQPRLLDADPGRPGVGLIEATMVDGRYIVGLGREVILGVPTDPEQLVVIDTQAPPRPPTMLPLPGARTFALWRDMAYVAGPDGLDAVRLTDIERPEHLGRLALPSGLGLAALRVQLVAGSRTLVLASTATGLVPSISAATQLDFLELAEGQLPVPVRTLRLGGSVTLIPVADEVLLVLGLVAPWALDIADPHRPQTLPVLGQVVSFALRASLRHRGRLLGTGSGTVLVAYEPRRDEPCAWYAEAEAPLLPRPGAARLLLPLVQKQAWRQWPPLAGPNPAGQLGGTYWGAAFHGHLVYLATGSGLTVADLSEPDAPRLLAEGLPLVAPADHLAVAGDTLYVVGQAGTLQVFDIADPPHPRLTARLSVPIGARGLVVSGSRLLVLGGFLMTELDISSPDHPQRLSTVFPPIIGAAYALAAGRLHEVTQTHVWRYDPSNGTAQLLWGPQPRADVRSVAGDARRLVISSENRVEFYDATDAQQLRWIAQVPLGFSWMALDGPLLHGVEALPRRLLVLRLLEDGTATVPWETNLADSMGLMAEGGRMLLLARRYDPEVTRVVDLSMREAPRLAGELPRQAQYTFVRSAGDTAYAWQTIGASGSWRILALTERGVVRDLGPALPVDRQRPVSWPRLVRRDTRLFGLARRGTDFRTVLDVMDIQDPRAPRLVRSLPLAEDLHVLSMAADDRYVYLWRSPPSGTRGEVVALDPDDPTPGRILGQLDLDAPPFNHAAMAAQGGLVYLSEGNGLSVVDFADPARPRRASRLPLPGPVVSLGLDRGRLHALTASAHGRSTPVGRLIILDLVPPQAPRVLGRMVAGEVTYPPQGDDQLAVAEDLVALPTAAGIDLIDVSDAARPRRLTELATGAAYSIALFGRRAYAASVATGFVVQDLAGWVMRP
jgi:hypothetical protein